MYIILPKELMLLFMFLQFPATSTCAPIKYNMSYPIICTISTSSTQYWKHLSEDHLVGLLPMTQYNSPECFIKSMQDSDVKQATSALPWTSFLYLSVVSQVARSLLFSQLPYNLRKISLSVSKTLKCPQCLFNSN